MQQFEPELRDRLVAYLDIDEAVAGQDALSPRIHPLLSQMLFDSAREFTQPDPQVRQNTYPPAGSSVLGWMLFRAREQNLVEKTDSGQDVPMYEYFARCILLIAYCYTYTGSYLIPVMHTVHAILL